MFGYSNINYGSDFFGAILPQTSIPVFSVSICIIWTRIVMPGARQPPGEANSGFRMQTHRSLTADWVVLEAWMHADVHCCDCCILSLPPSLPLHLTRRHATVPTVKRPNTCAFVLWCDKLRVSKSPEKAFSSSWVTRVHVAPSRLISSSNEVWIFNTYRWNGASTLAAWFPITRTLQIGKLWLKHKVFFSFLPLNSE